jgi:ribosome biogenesis GTPase / thiamine phosphate phosphatase
MPARSPYDETTGRHGPPAADRPDRPPDQPPDQPLDRLAQLGWDAGWEAAARAAAAGWGEPLVPAGPPGSSLRPGRVVRTDRGRVLVRTGTDAVHALVGDADVVTGDWVLLRGAGVRAVLPRRTAVQRGGGRREAAGQLLAANADVVLLVVALASAPNLARLDRLLTVAWGSGAQPVVVLSKADLSATAESERQEVAEVAGAAPVLVTSVVDRRGLDDLRALLGPGRTGALLGTSGAGKSSLVNALVGAPVRPVAPLRDDGKGRHTTPARELVVVPGLGVLLDTPGLRGVQMWQAERGLERTFTDVEALAARCRFGDCQHGGEPGCALAAAVADGRLSARRVDSYVRLQRETAWLQARYDARLRAEQRRRWKALSRAVRQRRPR